MTSDVKLTREWVKLEREYHQKMADESRPLNQGHALRVLLCDAWLNTETISCNHVRQGDYRVVRLFMCHACIEHLRRAHVAAEQGDADQKNLHC